jgi:hypothetical protein
MSKKRLCAMKIFTQRCQDASLVAQNHFFIMSCLWILIGDSIFEAVQISSFGFVMAHFPSSCVAFLVDILQISPAKYALSEKKCPHNKSQKQNPDCFSKKKLICQV